MSLNVAVESQHPSVPFCRLISTKSFSAFPFHLFSLSTSPSLSLCTQGALIPKAFSTKRLRKISIEVHRLKAPGKEGTYEECIIRVLEPVSKQVAKAAKAAHKEHLKQSLATDGPSVGTDDEASVVDVPSEYRVQQNDYLAAPDFDKGWKAKYRFPLSCISVKGTSRTAILVQITLGHVSHRRKLIFDTLEEAEDFCNVLEQEFMLEKERGDAKLQLAFAGKKMPGDSGEKITYLIEVVSAWNILAGDFMSSDPYVIVTWHGKEIHRTKYISKT